MSNTVNDNIFVRDIYREIGLLLMERDFMFKPLEQQKKILDEAFKQYIYDKIMKLGPKQITGSSASNDERLLDVEDLLNTLLMLIPEKDRNKNAEFFVFCLNNVISNIQGWSIMWYVEDDPELISTPILNVDMGKWNTLTTHEDTPPFQVFAFMYSQFQTEFMNEKKRLPNN